MTDTPILVLPELASAQAVPEAIVNENTRWLEFFAAGARVLDRGLTAPPGSPADGDAYLVAATATGAWAGRDGDIALRISTAWAFKEAVAGMILYVDDEDIGIRYDGAAWADISGGGGSLDVEEEGVSVDAATTIINFTGAGVTATQTTPGEVEVAIPGATGGGDWTVAATWDHAVAGTTALPIPLTGLGTFNDLMVVFEGLAQSASVAWALQVSVDNGSTWFTTSGNYRFWSTAGSTNADSVSIMGAATTNIARALLGLNCKTQPAIFFSAGYNTGQPASMFLGSTSPINAVRVISTGAASNVTSGKIKVLVK